MIRRWTLGASVHEVCRNSTSHGSYWVPSPVFLSGTTFFLSRWALT
jgi:hypothetical protein